MARGYPAFYPSVGRTAEGTFLPEVAEPPVWLHDDFNNNTSKWDLIFGTVTIQTEITITGTVYAPFDGSGLLYLLSELAGDGLASRSIGTFPQTSNCGFSCSILYHNDTLYKDQANSLTMIDCNYYTGTRHRHFGIAYNPATEEWSYLASDGATWTVFKTLGISKTFWHYCKLIIDPVTAEYKSFQVDNTVTSLSDISFYDVVSVLGVAFVISVRNIGAAAKQAPLLIDDYKITYGET